MFVIEPDKLDIKDTYVVFYLSCFIRRFTDEMRAKQMNCNAVLFELADVANA